MSFFQTANTEETIRIYADEESKQDYIEVRAELTKKEFNRLVLMGPKHENDIQGGMSFADKIVETFVVGWSAKDAEGNPIPFDIKTYQGLKASVANWISSEVMAHFNNITKTDVEDLEGKDSE